MGSGDRAEGLLARAFDSGFDAAHDTYNGMAAGSDGRIYYVLCPDTLDDAARLYSYDPAADEIRFLLDLNEACGQAGLKAVPQGKVHVPLIEHEGKLYFATHVGYYKRVEGMEMLPVPPPEGYAPYPGGHFLAYDMKTGASEDFAVAPDGEGILTMAMDKQRCRLYGITWPGGKFLRYDLATRELRNFGPISELGESVRGPRYRTLCRAMAVDPQDGSVYYTTSEGWIFRYRYDREAIERVEGEDLHKDYFGVYDPASPGHMGYNWRQVFWYEPEEVIYGVHGNSGYLFRFDPAVPRGEVLERLTSLPSKRSGMFDQFSYGYLGFTLGPDGRTIYYLTGGPIYVDGKRVEGKKRVAGGEAKGEENLHLVTYDIPTGRYQDHGPIFFEDGGRPSWVNSIAVGRDGGVYAVSRLERRGRVVGDLIRIPDPLRTEAS